MWCFIAFGTSIHCFPAPSLLFHHIQPYTTWDACNFGILCNTEFPGKRVGWLRRMKCSHTVGQEKTRSKARCTVMLLVTAEERSLWDVQWLLLTTDLPQDCWEALKDYLFCSSCNLQYPERGFSEEDCTSLAVFDANTSQLSADQPSALAIRLCCNQDSNKNSHVQQAAAYFWVSHTLFLLATISVALWLSPAEEGFCIFCFSLSLYEYWTCMNTKCILWVQSKNLCVCWSSGNQSNSIIGFAIGILVEEQNLTCWGWFSWNTFKLFIFLLQVLIWRTEWGLGDCIEYINM